MPCTTSIFCVTQQLEKALVRMMANTFSGNAKGGRITVPLTSCLTGLNEPI
jgi:hypothetical protein